MDPNVLIVKYFTNPHFLDTIEIREKCVIGQVSHIAGTRCVSRTSPTRLHDAFNRSSTPAGSPGQSGCVAWRVTATGVFVRPAIWPTRALWRRADPIRTFRA